MNKQRIASLLGKYQNGECTPEEARLVQQWYNQLDKSHGLDLEEKEKLQLEHKIWGKLEEDLQEGGWRTKKGRLMNWRFLSTAAAVILIVSALLKFELPKNESSVPDFTIAEIRAEEPGMIYEVNSSDQLKKLVMEDGSTITLAPESAITFPAHFAEDVREVTLEGDAFFEIAPHKQRPFVVKKDNLVTKVLGTSFWIKGHDNNGTLEVNVLTGKVSVFDQKEWDRNLPGVEVQENAILVVSHEKAIYNVHSGNITRSQGDSPLMESNAIPDMVMSNIQLPEILGLFKTLYGVDIELLRPGMVNCNFTGDLSNMQLYDALELLCKSVGATYHALGSKVIVEGNGC
jgi:transmembrane sensor